MPIGPPRSFLVPCQGARLNEMLEVAELIQQPGHADSSPGNSGRLHGTNRTRYARGRLTGHQQHHSTRAHLPTKWE